MIAGDSIDLRLAYQERYGTELPAWLNEALPSAARGQDTNAYLAALAGSLSDYASTRLQDRNKFAADVRLVVNKYRDEFAAAYAKAEAEGRLAEFYGEISGRVAFEMATIILPTKLAYVAKAGRGVETVAEVGRAADKAADQARAAQTIDSLAARADAEAGAGGMVGSFAIGERRLTSSSRPSGQPAFGFERNRGPQSTLRLRCLNNFWPVRIPNVARSKPPSMRMSGEN